MKGTKCDHKKRNIVVRRATCCRGRAEYPVPLMILISTGLCLYIPVVLARKINKDKSALLMHFFESSDLWLPLRLTFGMSLFSYKVVNLLSGNDS